MKENIQCVVCGARALSYPSQAPCCDATCAKAHAAGRTRLGQQRFEVELLAQEWNAEDRREQEWDRRHKIQEDDLSYNCLNYPWPA